MRNAKKKLKSSRYTAQRIAPIVITYMEHAHVRTLLTYHKLQVDAATPQTAPDPGNVDRMDTSKCKESRHWHTDARASSFALAPPLS